MTSLMPPRLRGGASLVLVLCLTVAMTLLGDWVIPSSGSARGFGGASGPRGSVAYTPRGSVAVGARGGAAARGPYGGAAVRGPGGAAAVRTPAGGAAARGPHGGVVAAPRGRVVPPPPPPGYRYPPGRVPVPVPVPVAPSYYGPPASGVAAGVVLGAMLTVLPATAIAIANSSGHTVYKVESKCYKEVQRNGATVYEAIPCP